MSKTKKIEVLNREVSLYQHREENFISSTDIARYRDAERSDYIIQNWMGNRNTIEFLGIWEHLNNPDLNSIEFDGIRNQAGLNSFEWIWDQASLLQRSAKSRAADLRRRHNTNDQRSIK